MRRSSMAYLPLLLPYRSGRVARCQVIGRRVVVDERKDEGTAWASGQMKVDRFRKSVYAGSPVSTSPKGIIPVRAATRAPSGLRFVDWLQIKILRWRPG